MPHKAVLFDLDGTLIDTLEDIGTTVNRILANNGFQGHELGDYRHFIGDGVDALITRALPEGNRKENTIRVCVDAFREEYAREWNVKTKPYDTVPEMLDALVTRGLKIAVLSNKPHEFTKRCVSEFFPNWTFHVVLGERDGFPRKPDPAGALEVADHLQIPPAQFIYLGDTDTDMKTAVAAGMCPVGGVWGYRQAEELRESGALFILKRPIELLSLLD